MSETAPRSAATAPPGTAGPAQEANDITAAPRWFDRLRLLPVVMIAATLLFGIKIGNIWQGADAVFTGIPQVLAQDANEGASPGTPPENAGSGTQDTEDDENAPEPAGETADAGTAEESAPYSRGELQLLQNLADRRSALDARAKEIEMRERVLTAMEKRIDKKIAEVKRIEAKISAHLEQYEDQHQQNLKKLIKVYESMEAEEAARIFEQLEMDILLQVAGRIRETKMAEILSEMDSKAAKTLTVELATKEPIPLPAN